MHRIYQCSSTLSHSYMFRRIRGAIFREFSMSLLNFCPMSWKRNGMRAVYCDRLCIGMLQDEGCILWPSVWWDIMGWELYIWPSVWWDVTGYGCILLRSVWWDIIGWWLYILTVCVVGYLGMRDVYCDRLCGGMLWDEGCVLGHSVWWDVMGWGLCIGTFCVVRCYGLRYVYCDRLCGGMLWDEVCILWPSVWWDVMRWGLYIGTVWPHRLSQYTRCNKIQQAHTELSEHGASDAPKHVGVR
jgi:hypothetical protein